MNYELCKKLKNAGFPNMDCAGCDNHVFGENEYHVPTLSEIIEACGDKFVRLERANGLFDESEELWQAAGDFLNIYTTGSTPEEAVALLYLKLKEN